MIRRAAIALLALSLAGCASGGQSLTQGGLSDAVSSFGTDHSYAFACRKFDPTTGLMTDEVTVQRNLDPNAAVVAMTGAAIQGVIGLVGAAKAAPVPGAMGARPGIPPGYTLDVPTCLGEHGVNTPMGPPPNPTPPQATSPPRQPAALEPGWHQGVTGTRRRLEPITGDGRASYYTVAGRHYVVSTRAWLAWAEGEG